MLTSLNLCDFSGQLSCIRTNFEAPVQCEIKIFAYLFTSVQYKSVLLLIYHTTKCGRVQYLCKALYVVEKVFCRSRKVSHGHISSQ